MSFVHSIPGDKGPEAILSCFPKTGQLLMDLTEHLLRGECQLSTAERELIASYVSGLNRCMLCKAGHEATAEVLGAQHGLVNSLLDDIEQADCPVSMKPIIYFVKKLTEKPYTITQADVSAVFGAGWDLETFYHIVSICALFNYFNRLVDGYGIRMANNPVDIGRYLAKHGYHLS